MRIGAIIALVLIIISVSSVKGQNPTFADDIAAIVYDNCSYCHRPGEIGPMPFTDYAEVSAYAQMIKQVTSSRYMPPWLPDPDYRHFLDERRLTDQQIQLIADWADAGAPRGDPSKEPPFPNFPQGSQLGTPDLILPMKEAFHHKGNNEDAYKIFVIPTGLSTEKDISAIEFRAGNPDIVHHAVFALDTQGRGAALDAKDSSYGYTVYGGFGGFSPDGAIGAYSPGQIPRFAPPGFGTKLLANSDLLMQMHYGPTSIAQTDSSALHVYYSKVPITRQILPFDIKSSNASEPFLIKADSIKTFHATFTSPFAVSLVFVYPHMHLLGKAWEVYGVTPANDTIDILKIDRWDFDWQAYYLFEKLQPIPAGSTLHAFATYDNTTSNPLNPNSPPIDVSWGERSFDEMLLLVFGFVFYQPGDENISLATGLEDNRFKAEHFTAYPVYPNPADASSIMHFRTSLPGRLRIQVLDQQGRRIKTLLQEEHKAPGYHSIEIPCSDLADGIYLIEMDLEGQRLARKLVVSH